MPEAFLQVYRAWTYVKKSDLKKLKFSVISHPHDLYKQASYQYN